MPATSSGARHVPTIAALYLFLGTYVSRAWAAAVAPRATTVPAPISYPPSQSWDGIDGSWSSFFIRVGTPAQVVRGFVSTASQETWTVDPSGCQYAPDPSSCVSSRGFTFNLTASTSWDEIGTYSLWIEQDLGYTGNAEYGFETVGLGIQGDGLPTVDHQIVGAMAWDDFWLGHFGVNYKTTNFTNFNDPQPSIMTGLKRQNLIPSISFGYTAGAEYRFNKVLGSLTLGGYDRSRFVPSDVSFDFAADNERDLVVGVQSIAFTDGAQTNLELCTTPHFSFIDSTVPQIWLPVDVCQAFEKAFGLVYDNATELYTVTDEQHQNMLNQNANVTFTLGQTPSGGPTVQIQLPYAAFDLVATYPYRGLQNDTRYFPIRRAANDTQYTLGRTLLQEAYLIVDWERSNFSVSQCSWEYGMPQSLVAISSGNDATNGTDTGDKPRAKLSGASIAGIAAGLVGAAVSMGFAGGYWFFRKRYQKRKKELENADARSTTSEKPPSTAEQRLTEQTAPTPEGHVIPKAELDASPAAMHEMDIQSPLKSPGTPYYDANATYFDTGTPLVPFEVDGKPRQIFEMPGDMPKLPEAGGRELSEKQAMMAREARINGVDPSNTSNASDTMANTLSSTASEHTPSSTLSSTQANNLAGRRPQVRPEDVVAYDRDNAVISGRSPGTPGAGSSSGGQISPINTTALSPSGEGSSSSAGSPSGMFGLVSPLVEHESPTNRRRFSYE